mmetsp:Transcript_80858/g.160258  ORF Transcript_80858/g.160258 Transcript_80858/m.160258 type:complete len:264 (-) Transcript_80858:123-914(-)
MNKATTPWSGCLKGSQPSRLSSKNVSTPCVGPQPLGLNEPPTPKREPLTLSCVRSDTAHAWTVFSQASPARDTASSCLDPSALDAALSGSSARLHNSRGSPPTPPAVKFPSTVAAYSGWPSMAKCICRTRHGQQISYVHQPLMTRMQRPTSVLSSCVNSSSPFVARLLLVLEWIAASSSTLRLGVLLSPGWAAALAFSASAADASRSARGPQHVAVANSTSNCRVRPPSLGVTSRMETRRVVGNGGGGAVPQLRPSAVVVSER